VTLTTTGAKSGQPRSVPLVGLPDGENIILIASNFGQTHYPAWYHNLRASPKATLTLKGRTGYYWAEEVSGEVREAYWRQAVALYPGYAAYERRVGARHIPVLRLTPTNAD
jgi:deazaflavin-dependent oxidoreductase (nitroreductase family)